MKRVMLNATLGVLLLASCTGQAEIAETPSPTATSQVDTPETDQLPASDPVPQAYVPAGQPGSAAAYAELIARLEQLVPTELRSQVPWPDLRNPDPNVAQIEIFELWIWMSESLPEPQLVEVMAAPFSPSREEIVSVFGELDALNAFERRPGAPYEAFDHLVVTFESSGLPLWLTRDVPDDAVVVYYSDTQGPVDVVDQDTGALLDAYGGVPERTWLSIMVPTDVGWQLWRDELIEPNDSELEVPDIPPPSADAERRKPDL